jgi:uncharacterized damage-inducible protein DinB
MDDLIEMWHAHNAIDLYLLSNVPKDGLEAVSTSDGMRVGQMFAHMNDIRLRWVQNAAPELTEQLPWFEQQSDLTIDTAQLQDALERSGAAVAALIRRSALAGVGIKDFPGSIASFLSYLISHESYHWGEIGVALTQSGRPLSKDVALGIWRGWWGRDITQPET